ncbi:MAG: hypothetical protein AAF596_10225 [Planctomycetota bacterium]
MSTDQAETFSPEAPPEKRGGGCLKSCLIAAVVMLLVVGLGALWVSMNWKSLAASAGTGLVQQVLAESGLPAEEQAEVMVEVQRVADAFGSGELTLEESGAMLQELATSPVMSTFVLLAIERGYLDDSGLSDEEKTAGGLALKRFARGFISEQIDGGAIDELMQHVADRDEEGNWQLRETVADDDLRALIETAKAKADEAGVPDEVEPIDPSDEIKKVVDKALAAP